jgi:hypothetical protein
VRQDIKQFQVGAVGPGPDPVTSMRPAQRGTQQGQVAGGDHNLIQVTERQVPRVTALHVPDLLDARLRATGQVLDIDKVQSALGKPFPAPGWLAAIAGTDNSQHQRPPADPVTSHI